MCPIVQMCVTAALFPPWPLGDCVFGYHKFYIIFQIDFCKYDLIMGAVYEGGHDTGGVVQDGHWTLVVSFKTHYIQYSFSE